MKKLLSKPLLFLVVFLFFLSACTKDEKQCECPNRMDRFLNSINQISIYPDLKFGSYWIFRNSVNGRFDTIKVAKNSFLWFDWGEPHYELLSNIEKQKYLPCYGSSQLRCILGVSRISYLLLPRSNDTLLINNDPCSIRFYPTIMNYKYINIVQYECYNLQIKPTYYSYVFSDSNYTELSLSSIKDTLNNSTVTKLSNLLNMNNIYIGKQTGFLKYSINDTTFTLVDSKLIR